MNSTLESSVPEPSRDNQPPCVIGDGAEVLIHGRIYVRTTVPGHQVQVGDLIGGWRVKARILVQSTTRMFISFYERGNDMGDPLWQHSDYAVLRPRYPSDDERRQNGVE